MQMRLFIILVGLVSIVGCDKHREEPTPAAKTAATTTATTPSQVRANGQLGPGAGTLLIDLKPPAGAELTEDAPVTVTAKSLGEGLTFPKPYRGKLKVDDLPIRLPVEVADGTVADAEVRVSYYYCTKGHRGQCRAERATLHVDLDLTGDAAGGEAYVSHGPRVN